jgi:hypothetical protein
MGDVYQNIDFERMLSDLGQALERNKSGGNPQPAASPAKPPLSNQDLGLNRIDAQRTQQGMAPLGAIGAPGGADPRTMSMLDPYVPDANPQDAQTGAALAAAGAAPTAMSAPPTIYPTPGAQPPTMSPQDQQTLAMMSDPAFQQNAVAFGGGNAPAAPALPPPPGLPGQLAAAGAAPTAMSAPPTPYPNIDPNAAGGLAGYAAMNPRR